MIGKKHWSFEALALSCWRRSPPKPCRKSFRTQCFCAPGPQTSPNFPQCAGCYKGRTPKQMVSNRKSYTDGWFKGPPSSRPLHFAKGVCCACDCAKQSHTELPTQSWSLWTCHHSKYSHLSQAMMCRHTTCKATFGLLSARADYFAVSTELPTQSWSLWTCHHSKYSNLSQAMMCMHATCKAAFWLPVADLIIAFEFVVNCSYTLSQSPKVRTTALSFIDGFALMCLDRIHNSFNLTSLNIT